MSSGYLGWESRVLSSVPHLDGVEWTDQGIPLSMAWTEADTENLFLIQTATGEHVLQAPFSGIAQSDRPSRMIFELPVQALDENVFRRLTMAQRKASVLRFVPHTWEMEHFTGAGVADIYSLSRPVAWGVAAGVSSGTHPAVFYKDGTVSGTCASLGGTLSQVLTVAEAGDIAVWYIPLFWVVVTNVSELFQGVNGLLRNVTLEEVRRYAS